ncbi:serine--tRNA ligase [Catenulispora rubra]|uniref:serine--tRNA ligase n=1 Tax=Catenulispora rubra TaxID=280293 RepID=UPI00189264CA|nr:serine--tRNA ligase [Catenulispora rubra]
MLDIKTIREEPDRVQEGLAKRGLTVDLRAFLELDDAYRTALTNTELLRARRRRLSTNVGTALASRDGDAEALRQQAAEVSDQVAAAEKQLERLRQQRQDFLDGLPNLPDDGVAAGGKENNEVVRTVGEPPIFDFPALDHVELAERLKLIDYRLGAKLGGTGFWAYRGDGALAEWALLNYFVETHRRDGYEFILPPHLLTYDVGYAAGQFPKFVDDVFTIPGEEQGQFLLPTAETALAGMHRGEVLQAAGLPLRYFAFSPCYRREIGGYRTTERGTLRGHQFHKVELFALTAPDDSDDVHAELLAKAEELVAGLGLHYRVSRLAAGDTSAAMAVTYDVEVWLPSLGDYVEVSSVSNARDYQARRGDIRFQNAGVKAGFVHTLNASGLATSRLLPAILEQHQRADGGVAVPAVMRRWLPEVLSVEQPS